MSVAQATDFINLTQKDEELAKALKAAPNREAREAVASSKGYTFTPEEMAQAVSEHPQQQSANGELSDEALAGVAGGGGITFGIPGWGGGISW